MIELSKRPHRQEPELRRLIFLEFLAASVVLVVIGTALFLVLTYKPV